MVDVATFCGNCGNASTGEGRYCGECGAGLSSPLVTPQAPPLSAALTADRPQIQAEPVRPLYDRANSDIGPISRRHGTNGLAIASLVLGILWIWWIGSLLALVFGFIAKRQIDNSFDPEWA